MNEPEILTKFMFPVMLQIVIIAMIAAVLRNNKITIGYGSVIGMEV